MGVVHLALDAHGRAVAIKVLRPHVAYDPEARWRLAREVDTLTRIRSTRVAAVIDADITGDRPYLVTRYVPGPSLDDVVTDEGPLGPDELRPPGPRSRRGPGGHPRGSASCTGTSSPATCCSRTASRSSSTSASPTSPTTCG